MKRDPMWIDGAWTEPAAGEWFESIDPYRGKPWAEIARARETGGVGLGLAIVRSSVAACGGEVHFSNRTPHGFRAEIRLSSA